MTTEIVFIVLNSAIKSRIVCDLTENCYLKKERLVIFTKNEDEGKRIDSLIWTWKQHSFVPHKYLERLSTSQKEPVVLTTNIENPADYTTVLLVAPLPVEQVKQFSKVIDFAEKYDSSKIESSRQRYKIYKEHDLKISTLQPGEFLHSASI